MNSIRDSGQRRKTRAGCLAAVYVACGQARVMKSEPRKPSGGFGLLEVFDATLGLNGHAVTEAARVELYGERRYWPERDRFKPVSADELFGS